MFSGPSKFPLLPQLLQKMTLDLKVVKSDSKIIILHCYSKSVTHSVALIYSRIRESQIEVMGWFFSTLYLYEREILRRIVNLIFHLNLERIIGGWGHVLVLFFVCENLFRKKKKKSFEKKDKKICKSSVANKLSRIWNPFRIVKSLF